jgi:hypothetical protein
MFYGTVEYLIESTHKVTRSCETGQLTIEIHEFEVEKEFLYWRHFSVRNVWSLLILCTAILHVITFFSTKIVVLVAILNNTSSIKCSFFLLTSIHFFIFGESFVAGQIVCDFSLYWTQIHQLRFIHVLLYLSRKKGIRAIHLKEAYKTFNIHIS